MGKFFNHYDAEEKKYIFNSFMVLVGVVELIILGVTLIWQIDEGWLGGEVRVIPFPWRDYLVVAMVAPLVMMFLFTLIMKGFDVFGTLPEQEGKVGRLARWKCQSSKIAYIFLIFGLLLLVALIWQFDKAIPLAKKIFDLLGLWGSYTIIGFFALAMLSYPISLFLRYRLCRKAMEYQYLLALAEKHGLAVDEANKKLIVLKDQEEDQASLEHGRARPLPLPPAGEEREAG